MTTLPPTVCFKICLQNDPKSKEIVEFEHVADSSLELISESRKQARFKFNDILFKVSCCDQYKDSAILRLYQDEELVKESRANERFAVPPEELLGKDEDYISPPPRHQPSKRCKYIDGNGKEIELSKNAYMHFCLEHRVLIKGGLLKEWRYMLEEFPDLSESEKTRAVFGNTTKRLSLLWSSVNKEIKDKFLCIASQDKKRFDLAMASNPMNAILLNEEKEMKANNLKRKNLTFSLSSSKSHSSNGNNNIGYLNEVEYLNELMGGRNGNGGVIQTTHSGMSNELKKRTKNQKLYDLDGIEIKKPLTSYFHFCAEHRARVTDEVKLAEASKMVESASSPTFGSYSEMPSSSSSVVRGLGEDSEDDLSKKELPGITKVVIRLGEMWRALSPQEKMIYDDLAAKDKIRFETAVHSNPNNEWYGTQPQGMEMNRIASFASADEASHVNQYQQLAFQQQQQRQHLQQQQRLQQLKYQQQQEQLQLRHHVQQQSQPQHNQEHHHHHERREHSRPSTSRNQPSHEEQLHQLQLQLQIQQQQYQQQLEMLMKKQPSTSDRT